MIYNMDNIRLAHRNAQKGKQHYSEVCMVNQNPDKFLTSIHQTLKYKTFANSPYECFIKEEKGKKREIFKLPYYPDRIIHHAIMQILEPIWMDVYIRDTYASMKGRGIHDGARRLSEFLKDTRNTQYCLKLDVRKFYPSIDHDILKGIVRRKIKCRDTLWLLDRIIDSASGVPIGNYLSQHLANLYLAYFDHWAKENRHIRYYARYCDDIVALDSSKERLHEHFHAIQEYLKTNLKLEVKDNWQIFPIDARGIDFLGYRFWHNRRIKVRKRIALAFCRKADQMAKRPIRKTDANMLMSYYGWFSFTGKRNLWIKKVAPIQPRLVLAFADQTPQPIRSVHL